MTGRTLAFDTSSRAISIALLQGEQVLAEVRHSPESAGSSRLLAPTIHQLMQAQGWGFEDLERLILPLGPGSFSGLRMGLVTAKLLAYARGLPIAGLNTLQIIASRGAESLSPQSTSRIIALLDAQRGELFAQAFLLDQTGIPQPEAPREIVSATELASRFPEGVFTGSGLRVLTKRRGIPPAHSPAGELPPEIAERATPTELWDCTAAAAGRLAARMGATLTTVDCWSAVPDYGRPSAAEEKAIERARPIG